MRIILASVLFLTGITCLTSFSHEIENNLPDGRRYTFKVNLGETDLWDSGKYENPPLSQKKAKEIAEAFMKTISLPKAESLSQNREKAKAFHLPEEFIGWGLDNISLKRISGEKWIYEVT